MRVGARHRFVTALLIVALVFSAAAGVLFSSPQAAYAAADEAEGVCSGSAVSVCLSYILFYLPFVALTAPITFLAGQVLNYSIAFSLSKPIIGNPFVETGWKIVRDVANLAFIFILIYIAIATILSVENFHTWRLLASVVVVALLVNFSLFAARVVIDASNFLAVEFYNKMAVADVKTIGIEAIRFTDQKTGAELLSPKDLSGAVMTALGTAGLLNTELYSQIVKNKDGAFFQNFAMLATLFILFGITNLITAGAFIAGALIFVGRIIALWLLMIAAAAGFVAFILPQTKKYAIEWWSKLLCYSFVAPVYLFLFYLFLLFLTGGGKSTGNVAGCTGELSGTFVGNLLCALGSGANTLAKGAGGESKNFWIAIGFLLLNFIVVFVFLFAITRISKTMGCAVGEKAVAWLSNPRTYTPYASFWGRNTFGRFAYLAAENRAMRWLSHKLPRAVGAPMMGLRKVAGYGFGDKKSYQDVVDRQRAYADDLARYAAKGRKGAPEIKRDVYRKLGTSPVPGLGPVIVSTGAKERYKDYESKKVTDVVANFEASVDKFNETVDDLNQYLQLWGTGEPKLDKTSIGNGSEEKIQDAIKHIDKTLTRFEDQHKARIEGESTEAVRNNYYAEHRDYLFAEKKNERAVRILREMKEALKKGLDARKAEEGDAKH